MCMFCLALVAIFSRTCVEHRKCLIPESSLQAVAEDPEKFAESLRKQSKSLAHVDPADFQVRSVLNGLALKQNVELMRSLNLNWGQAKLRLFSFISGVEFVEHWNENLSDFVLAALGRLFTVLLPKPSLLNPGICVRMIRIGTRGEDRLAQ